MSKGHNVPNLSLESIKFKSRTQFHVGENSILVLRNRTEYGPVKLFLEDDNLAGEKLLYVSTETSRSWCSYLLSCLAWGGTNSKVPSGRNVVPSKYLKTGSIWRSTQTSQRLPVQLVQQVKITCCVIIGCQPTGKPMNLLRDFPVLPCGGAWNWEGIAEHLGVKFLEVVLRCSLPKYSPELRLPA